MTEAAGDGFAKHMIENGTMDGPVQADRPIQLEFENGNLVKVDGMRPEYMDGDRLIALVRGLAKDRQKISDRGGVVEYQLREVIGTVEEYQAMRCTSLFERMDLAVQHAKRTVAKL